ncbi:MAG TPA: class I SAM-dependent methyltransferase [Bacteroidota bacterium]|nr:class I SAM-dependent methyltransferase [Bacteroidota bacterium]
MSNERNRVCPVELADSLDSRIRGWVQNPRKILAPYVSEGMTVLDIGCGPGFFSVELAKIVGARGKVYAADLQEGMLAKLRDNIQGTALQEIITPVQCGRETINVPGHFDFGLAFYMVHEVPDKGSFFRQLKSLLNEQGRLLVVEPKLFHVSEKEFALTTAVAESAGFKIHPGPRLPLSWSALLSNT